MTKPECVTVVRIPGAMPEHVSVRAELGPFRGDSTRTEIQLSFEAGSPPEVEVSENRNRPANDVPEGLKTDRDRARRAPRGASWSGTGLEG